MPKVKKYKNQSIRKVEAQLDGEVITIHYDESKYTTKFINEMTGVDIGDFLAPLLISTDLVDEDDQGNEVPYPLTRESLAELPLILLRAIQQAIMADALPNQRRGQTSAGSFGRED